MKKDPASQPPPMTTDNKTAEETCDFCDGDIYWYGLAPHTHNMKKTGSVIGSTEILPKEKYPWNFREDEECEGCGVWTCDRCQSPPIPSTK